MKLTLIPLLLAATASAGPVLFTIGAGGDGVSNQLVQIDTNTQTTSVLATIGDGLTAHRGLYGLGTNAFSGFSIADDGTVSRVSFTSAGVVTGGPAVGQFTPGGLTTDGASVWWSEIQGVLQSVVRLQGGGVVASAAADIRGVAYNPSNNYLYILAVGNGFAYLTALDPGNGYGGVNSYLVGDSSLNGGLAWDPVTAAFYAIGTPAGGSPTVYRFVEGQSNAFDPLFALNTNLGIRYSSLMVGAADAGGGGGSGNSATPEPATAGLLAGGLALFFLMERVRR